MSDRERAQQLLNTVPDDKIAYVIAYIQGLTADINEVEETDPDLWDLKMIEAAEKDNDGSVVSLDDLLKKDNLSYADL